MVVQGVHRRRSVLGFRCNGLRTPSPLHAFAIRLFLRLLLVTRRGSRQAEVQPFRPGDDWNCEPASLLILPAVASLLLVLLSAVTDAPLLGKPQREAVPLGGPPARAAPRRADARRLRGRTPIIG